MTDAFWTGGPDAYEKGLRQEHQAAVDELKARCEQCTDPALRDALEDEIRAIKAIHRSTLERIKQLIF